MKFFISSNMLSFAKRNILKFFRDKTAVFFSLLSALIIIGLYVLFLGDLLVMNLNTMFPDNARFIVDSWIMAGVISITSITSAMGAFEAMVNDKTSKALKDFYSAPISRREIAGGYIISAFLVGLIMSIIALAFAEIYILIYGGKLLPVLDYIKILGVVLLSVLSSCTLMFFIVSFLRSSTAFATCSTIVGTLIGFLTGVYLPIGQLPEAIGAVVKIIPVSHSVVLLRQIMMNDALQNTAGMTTEMLSEFKLDMGVNFKMFGTTLTPLHSVVILIVMAALFFFLSVIRISKKDNY